MSLIVYGLLLPNLVYRVSLQVLSSSFDFSDADQILRHSGSGNLLNVWHISLYIFHPNNNCPPSVAPPPSHMQTVQFQCPQVTSSGGDQQFMSLCKYATGAADDDGALVRGVCRCAQDGDKLGRNGIKVTDGIIWPEFVERTQTDRKIQGRMTHIEEAVKRKRGERKEVGG